MLTLFHNARILTMDADFTEIRQGWVLVDGNSIARIGEGDQPEADTQIDLDGDILMPGMVNTHCHMTMTLFRGLGEDVDDRLFRYVLPLEREAITPDTVRIGSQLAALEMILGGVTTVADMYYFEQEVGRVIDKAGMRGVVGQTLADFSPPDHATFDEGFALVDALRDEFADSERVIASIAPHAPYSTGIPVMERVAAYHADNPDVAVQMHLAEMQSEMEWCAHHHNARPVEVADSSGILAPGAIMAHCLEVNEVEIALLAQRGVTIAHNARSNAKAGRGIAPVEAMRRAGIPVGIATDGPMSGNTLDLFSQFAPVSMFAKLLGRSRKPMPARDVIAMATCDGARVLGLDRQIGSIEQGKRADLVRVSLDGPHLHPIYDPYATLVFATSASDVRDVMVDGRWLLRDRELQTMEKTKVLRDALQVADGFRRKMNLIDARD